MDDLISRQAAIEWILQRLDALKGVRFGTSTFRDGIADGYARIMSDLKYLPSAEPERYMVTMAEPTDLDRLKGIIAKSSDITIIPLPKAETGWIPVTDRLPNDDDWQLVTVLDESGDTPYRYSDFGWYLEAAECWIVNANQRTDIIAWMPLPEPWKGEDDG